MVGLNKFSDKEKRQQRRNYERNHLAIELRQPKYRQRTISRKRIEDDEDPYEEWPGTME